MASTTEDISEEKVSEEMESDDPKTQMSNSQCCYFPKRYIQAILIMIGFMISFGMRGNIGVAIVKMLSNKTDEYGNIVKIAEFHWSPKTIGYIDSSLFWGNVVTQIPGGFLAYYFPSNKVFGVSILLLSLLNLLAPAASMLDPHALIGLKFVQGLVEGVTVPASFGILRWWAPHQERTGLVTLAFSGSAGGVLLGHFISGHLADEFGWWAPYCFYGCAGIVWFIFWHYFSYESPAKHSSISTTERLYIENTTGDESKLRQLPCPWLSIVKSLPVWTIVIASFANYWSLHVILVLPYKYLKEMHSGSANWLWKVSILIITIAMPLGGQVADCLHRRMMFSDTVIRKIFYFCGLGGQALSLMGLYFLDAYSEVVSLLLAAGFSGIAISGFHANHLDLAPTFSSILMGFSNCVSALTGIISYQFTDYMLDYSNNNFSASYYYEMKSRWNNVFLTGSLILMVGAVFSIFGARGNLQNWAKTENSESENQLESDRKRNIEITTAA